MLVRDTQLIIVLLGGLPGGQTRCGEHTDWISMTLLIQDQYGGLEVQEYYLFLYNISFFLMEPSVCLGL